MENVDRLESVGNFNPPPPPLRNKNMGVQFCALKNRQKAAFLKKARRELSYVSPTLARRKLSCM
jgi:hypothetical protein